ncbi:MAG: 4-phosphoerythronate dehydrogenase [Pseudomonadota bacterium]|nr:4-phosphoerythronate dehydrogenase [Pseudomonadales bacterium]MDY6918764.1 4-phosphoerythronate dehydrogenase [Pseudomonadota bacterium]
MKILVDENIPVAEACFGQLGEVVPVSGRHLRAAQVRDADALIVRSVTPVNESLLAGSRIGFVGTATIGVDHIDQAYLAAHGIGFASAPGCNARSVVEYVAAALMELEASRRFSLSGKSIGIIGVGNVGSRLRQLCEALGLRVLACDPPLQARGEPGLVSADEAWQADIVSLHVPYNLNGVHGTHHLADYQRLSRMLPGAVLINTARGPVVDNRALSRVLDERYDLAVVLDVWEGEPFVNMELASQVDIATPHIAGYSHDGKVRGTWMIYQALCRHLGQAPQVTETDLIDPALTLTLDPCAGTADTPTSARDLITRIYDIREDDLGLRASLRLPRERRAQAFDALRRQYRVRREFQSVQVRGRGALQTALGQGEFQRLKVLGLQFD